MQRSNINCRLGASIPGLLCICLVFLVSCRGYDPLTSIYESGESDLGALVVSIVVTGGAFDLDGFDVGLDGSLVGVADPSLAVHVPGGPHTVELSGVADNCSAIDGSSREVTITGGSTTRIEFSVACTPPPELASIRIAYVQAAEQAPGSAIVAMNADGSDRVVLTSGDFHDYGPAVSPDGKFVAFMRDPVELPFFDPDIYVMSSDGTDARQLVAAAYDPAWSPDGDRLAFVGGVVDWGGAVEVIGSDGGGVRKLTSGETHSAEDAWPAWSPDGTRIAFIREGWPPDAHYWYESTLGVWIVNSDGTGAAPVRTGGPWGPVKPVWSPDGTRIAFVEGEGAYPSLIPRIRVVDVDGSSVTTLWKGDAGEDVALDDWSSDGELMLFTEVGHGHDVYLLRYADGAVVRLTADGHSSDASFWPSGA